MKVCHFAATKGIGRGEAFVEIANEMSNRIETHLLAPQNPLYWKNISQKVKTACYESKGSRNNPFLLFEIYQYFKDNQFDLVHTHFAKATVVFARLNRFLKIPHLATKHNPRESRAFNSIRNVTVVSREAVLSVANKNGSVRIIRNGISIKPTPVVSSKCSGQTLKILAVGRLDPVKGFDLLIEQLSNLKFDFYLSLAGEGPEREKLESLASKKLGAGNYCFLGFRHDIEQLMVDNDLVVSSSHTEGCPMVLIEALFHAKLFISTPVGEAADLLPKHFLAKIDEIAGKISEIKQNYSIMSEEFRKFADDVKGNYSAKTMVDQYIEAYESLLCEQKK